MPGRLRIRCSGLRRNEQKASAVQAMLASIAGVTSAAVNPLTGSITLHYEANAMTTAAVLDLLTAHGCFDAAGSNRQPVVHRPQIGVAGSRSAATPAPWLVKVAAGFLVEKAIERSLLALVAAIL
jgi:hypothetical protein